MPEEPGRPVVTRPASSTSRRSGCGWSQPPAVACGVVQVGWALTLIVVGLALLLVARLGVFAFTLGLGLLPFLLIAGGVVWAVSTALAHRRNGDRGGPGELT